MLAEADAPMHHTGKVETAFQHDLRLPTRMSKKVDDSMHYTFLPPTKIITPFGSEIPSAPWCGLPQCALGEVTLN